MTNAAAFRATYADWKLIKTRSVVQVVFEVPLEQADLAYQVIGGMPDPGAERWCAIARLNEGGVVLPLVEVAGPAQGRETCGEQDRPHSPRKPIAPDKRMAQRAGMLCSDVLFQQFLLEKGAIKDKNEPEAAEFVRQYCGIESRSELIPGEPAAMCWTALHSEFEAWRMV